jgi:hypothetical protein
MFELLFERFNSFYEKIFHNYGLFIVKYYKYTIAFSFLINILLSFGLLRMKLITDSDELFSVINSKAKADEARLKQIFINNKDFYENKYYLHQLLGKISINLSFLFFKRFLFLTKILEHGVRSIFMLKKK